MKSIQATIDDSLYNLLKKKYPGFNPYAFYHRYQKRYDGRVVMEALIKLGRSNIIRSPWAWAEHQLPIWNQNLNEREYQKKAQEHKSIYNELVECFKKMQGGK